MRRPKTAEDSFEAWVVRDVNHVQAWSEVRVVNLNTNGGDWFDSRVVVEGVV